MKMKRILSVLTALTVIAAPCPSAFAEGINRTYSSVGTESETLKKKMENTVIFRIDNPEAYAANYRCEIENGNGSTAPFTKDGAAYIPLEFTVRELGGAYAETDGGAEFTIDGRELNVNDGGSFGSGAAVMSRGRMYAAAKDFGTVTGRDVLESGNLVIVAITREYKLGFSKNELERLEKMLLYKWYNAYLGAEGFATGIIIHPKDKTQMYCRTDVGGAYRYDNRNGVWYSITDSLVEKDAGGEYRCVMGMAVDPTDTETIYLAVKGEVLKTTDGGKSWRELGLDRVLTDGQNRLIGEPIAVDPNDRNTVYFGTDTEGLFISRDGGENWIHAVGVPSDADFGIRSMVFDKNSGTEGKGSQTAYVGVTGHGVYVTYNGGKSFSKMNGSPTHPARMKIAGGKLFVTMMKRGGTMQSAMSGGLYVYSGGGWHNITPPAAAGKDMDAIAVRESDPNYIIVCLAPFVGSTMYRSTDGGATWEKGGYSTNIADMCFNPLNEKELLLVYGAGLNKITDTDDISFPHIRFDTGIEEFCTARVQSVPGAKIKLFSGNLDWGLFRNYELTQRAERIGNPFMADTTSINYCGTSPNIVMAGGASINYGNGTALLEISKDYGETWETVESWDKGAHILEVAVGAAPTENGYPNAIVLAFSGANPGYYISSDGMKTWQRIDRFGTNGTSIWSRWADTVAADKVDPNTFYICKNGEVYVTRNAGKTWKTASSRPAPANNFTRIATVPGMAGTLTFTSTTGLYISTNYGSSWRQCDEITWAYAAGFGIGKDGKSPAIYTYGKKNKKTGIYLSDDLGRTWRLLNEGYTIPNVHDSTFICGDMNVYGRVFIGTTGRGTIVGQPVTVKDTLPVITLEDTGEKITGHSTHTVRGSVSQPAEVRINGAAAELDGNLNFEKTVTLAEGENRISVEAVSDGKYKATPQYIDIKYVPGYVGLALNKSADYIADTQKITVSGTATEAGTVYINGAAYPLDGANQFSAEFTLAEGENPFEVYAADHAGNRSETYSFSAKWDTTVPSYETVDFTPEVDENYYILKLKMNEDGEFRIGGKNILNCKKDTVAEYMLPLSEGDNKVKIEARDLAHNVAQPTELTISSRARSLGTANLDAGYVSEGKIRLDGVLDEDIWKGEHILTRTITGVCNNIVTFDAYWSEDALYVGVNVKDSTVICDSNSVHEDDSVEVYIDADNCKAAKYCAGTRQLQFRCDGAVAVSGADYATKRTADGYSMEIRIPWKDFGVTPKADMVIGFDVANNDDDGTKGGSRSGLLGWHNSEDTNYASPKGYANLKLTK